MTTIGLFTWGEGGPYKRQVHGLAAACEFAGWRSVIITLGGELDLLPSSSTHIALRSRSASTCIRQLAAVLRNTRPSFLLVTPSFLAPPGILAARLANVPVAPWEGAFPQREMSSLPFKMRLLRPLQRVTYPLATFVLGKSPDVVADLRKSVSRRAQLLPPALDHQQIQRSAAQDGQPSSVSTPTIVSVGRLVPEKGFDLLLQALAQLPTEAVWQLKIIGEGPERPRLEGMVRTLGLSDRVRFLGHLSSPLAHVKTATVLAAPSRWEGFGIAIGEALVLGTPVVAARCAGGPAYMLRGGGGILVRPEDPVALAGAIRLVLSDNSLREQLRREAIDAASVTSPELLARNLSRLIPSGK
jgi:glycosyltransferase involved in cell wall biosynthesis